MQAFIKLKEKGNIKPSLNFLYAMVGALDDHHWAAIKASQKAKLLLALEEQQELQDFKHHH